MSFDIGGSGPTSQQETTSATGQGQSASRQGQVVGSGSLGLGKQSTYTDTGAFTLGKNARLTIVSQGPSTSDLVSALQAAAVGNTAPQVSDQSQSNVDWVKWLEYGALIFGGLLLVFAIRKKIS